MGKRYQLFLHFNRDSKFLLQLPHDGVFSGFSIPDFASRKFPEQPIDRSGARFAAMNLSSRPMIAHTTGITTVFPVTGGPCQKIMKAQQLTFHLHTLIVREVLFRRRRHLGEHFFYQFKSFFTECDAEKGSIVADFHEFFTFIINLLVALRRNRFGLLGCPSTSIIKSPASPSIIRTFCP